MRFEQIIAVVARRLVIAGVREVKSVVAFARVGNLPLCMASVSPGMYSGSQLEMHLMHCHWGWNWNPPTATPATTVTGSKRKRSLLKRLVSLPGLGHQSLPCRDR